MSSSIKDFYNNAYKNLNYSRLDTIESTQNSKKFRFHSKQISHLFSLGIIPTKCNVLEIGCGLGHFNVLFKGKWSGIDISSQATDLGKELYGNSLNFFNIDICNEYTLDDNFDFIYSIAALEHLPKIELAIHNIDKSLKPGGVLYLAPAWNARSWTVEKLKFIPYTKLNWSKKVKKFFIPIISSKVIRFLNLFPRRIFRELKFYAFKAYNLNHVNLYPDFSLIEQYGHVSDDDAFISLDSHDLILFLKKLNYYPVASDTLFYRLFHFGSPIVMKKNES